MTHSDPVSPTSSRWVAPAALLIAVAAMGVGILAIVRSPGEPPPSTGPAVSAQQSDDGKTGVCVAFEMVRNAVSTQTNIDMGPDPVAREAVAANARLATLGGGEYLLSRLNPATPRELVDAVRSFANNLQDIGIKQLGGASNADPTVAALLNDAQGASTRIADMCK